LIEVAVGIRYQSNSLLVLFYFSNTFQ